MPVAERNVALAVGEIYDIYKLADRNGLAGEGGLLDLQARVVDYPAVCGNSVAGLEQYNVANDELLAVNGDYFPAAQHLGRRRRHLLQSLYRLFGLVLLINAQHGIYNDDKEDDDNIRKALALRYRKHTAYSRRDEQNDYHGVCKLLQKLLYYRILLCRFELIRPVFGKAALGLSLAQAVFAAFELCYNALFFFAIILHLCVLLHIHIDLKHASCIGRCDRNIHISVNKAFTV